MLLPLLLGQGTAGPQNYTLSVDPASFSVTPVNNALQVARQLPVTATSYAYSHPANSLAVGRQLPITATSYAWTPANNALLRTYALPVDAASLAWSPANPTLVAGRQWSADAAAYTYAPANPVLTTARALSITAESLAASFVSVTLDYVQSAKQLLPDATAWAISFSNPALTVQRAVSIDATIAAATFATATAELQRQLSVAPGSYDIIAATAAVTATRQLSVYPHYITYVQAGYVQDGYVGRSTTWSLDTNYVTTGYVLPGYVGPGVSAGLAVGRALAPTPASIVVNFATVDLVRERASYPVSLARASLLYRLWQLHGLDAAAPLSVSATARSAGPLQQSISGTGPVSITTTAAADFEGDTLDAIIDELAAIYGLTGTLTVSTTARSAGSVVQAISSAGGTTTVTRQ